MEELVCYYQKFAHFMSKQTDLSAFQNNFVRSLKILTENQYGVPKKTRCSIAT